MPFAMPLNYLAIVSTNSFHVPGGLRTRTRPYIASIRLEPPRRDTQPALPRLRFACFTLLVRRISTRIIRLLVRSLFGGVLGTLAMGPAWLVHGVLRLVVIWAFVVRAFIVRTFVVRALMVRTIMRRAMALWRAPWEVRIIDTVADPLWGTPWLGVGTRRTGIIWLCWLTVISGCRLKMRRAYIPQCSLHLSKCSTDCSHRMPLCRHQRMAYHSPLSVLDRAGTYYHSGRTSLPSLRSTCTGPLALPSRVRYRICSTVSISSTSNAVDTYCLQPSCVSDILPAELGPSSSGGPSFCQLFSKHPTGAALGTSVVSGYRHVSVLRTCSS